MIKSGVRSQESGVRPDLQDLLGKPFKYGARGPDRYDCYGLCMEIYRRLGRQLPDYGSAVLPSLIDRMIHEVLAESRGQSAKGLNPMPHAPCPMLFTPCDTPEPWCLVLFRIRPPYVSHIGVVLPPHNGSHLISSPLVGEGRGEGACTRFIHIMRSTRVCIERLDSPDWQRRVAGYLKFL